MKRKLIQICSVLLLGILLLCGCSGKMAEPPAEQVTEKPLYRWGDVSGETITVWGDKDELARPYMRRAFQRYQDLTGNIIETVSLSKTEIDQNVPRAFASETEERPDILLSYGGTNIENLNPDENFHDFSQAPWVDDLSDTAINQAIFNGKVIGFPHGEASVSGTLYHKEIFQRLGIQIPKTQAEFMDACEKLLQNGVTPLYLPYAEITMLLYQFPMDSFLNDESVLNGLNNGTLSYAQIPEMKQIVAWYKTMADRGYLGTDYTKNDWNGMDGALKSGKYAMMLCWDTWLYTSYTGDATKIGLMPAFVGTPENGCFEGANIILCIVNKKNPNLYAALDLIRFMADPCNYNIAYAGVYTAPVFNQQSGSITTPQYMEAERLIDKLFYDSTAWLRVRGFSQIDASYIQEFMQNECTLEECLRAMDASRMVRAGVIPAKSP